MTRVSVTEAVRRFADYVNRVAYRGERFVLVRGGRNVAELGPVAQGRPLSELPALLAGLPALDPAEAGAFAMDLDFARDEPGPVPETGVWES